jgi:hypothetical protein
VNTFLPYWSFVESASCLDYRRLGKQRIEVKQIYLVLKKSQERDDNLFKNGYWESVPKPFGWENHPATKMWRGHERALLQYGIAICREWSLRGYKDNQMVLFQEWIQNEPDTGLPSWIGNDAFHRAMRSNLLRKDQAYYSRFGWNEPTDLPYIWGSEL